jgi:putative membrane protein
MSRREEPAIAPGLYDPAEFVARTPRAPAPPAPAAGAAAETPMLPAPPPNPWRRRLAWSGLALAALFGLVQAGQFVAAAAALAPALGWVAAAAILAALASALLWGRWELREFRRIARVEALQDEATRLLAADQAGAAEAWFAAIARQMADAPGAVPGLARFQAMAVDGYAARDALGLFEREVMADLDRAAVAAIARAARDSALGTAASPVALLDAAIVFARALRMIREIAAIYGFRPGGLAALGLLRRVLVQSAGVAGADIVGELSAEMLGSLGHKLAGTVSARLGVGIFAATRVARLGLATLAACRPLPFVAERPLLARVLREALGG